MTDHAFTSDELLALHLQPAPAGRRASARRAAFFGDAIWIRAMEPASAAPLPWPAATGDAGQGDRILLHVEPSDADRRSYAQWLLHAGVQLPTGTSVSAYSREPAGLHRLWCLAAARLVLPPGVRVDVRHDLVGIRLAQVALGFGVDTFAGPLQDDRKLPLAGVTRPDEATRAGISTLVRAAGLRPVFDPKAKAAAS